MASFLARPPALVSGFISPSMLSNRAMVFAVIVALHVVLGYLFATGLVRTTLAVLIPPIEGSIVDQPVASVEPPPPAQPDLERPRIDVVMPDFPINDPVPDRETTALDLPSVVDPPPIAPPIQRAAEPLQIVGTHRIPNAEDYYSPSLIREGIEGSTNVRVCVNENGRVQGTPTVEKSSGNARMDEDAIKVVRDGRYARAKRGEAFVPNCYGFRIIFQIRK